MDGSRPQLRPFTPRPLWPEDLSRLRMDVHPRVSHSEAVDVLDQSPGSSFWIPAVDEFLLVAPWRHREELSTVHTFGAFRYEDSLMRTVMDHAESSGKAGFVVVDLNEIRQPQFYEKHGLLPFESIVTYSLTDAGQRDLQPRRNDVQFRHVTLQTTDLLEQVIALDHQAFPWFWWNSPAEFQAYLDYPGVEVWAMMHQQRVIAYAGITGHRRWGHLDRIAVDPAVQGNGIGYEMLAFAVRKMKDNGARSVALSTQGNNARSRRLYERSGFTHTPKDDYTIHVASFNNELMYSGMNRTDGEPMVEGSPSSATVPPAQSQRL